MSVRPGVRAVQAAFSLLLVTSPNFEKSRKRLGTVGSQDKPWVLPRASPETAQIGPKARTAVAARTQRQRGQFSVGRSI